MTEELDNIGKIASFIGNTALEHAMKSRSTASDLLQGMAVAYVMLALTLKHDGVDLEELRPDLIGAVEEVIDTMVEALHEKA